MKSMKNAKFVKVVYLSLSQLPCLFPPVLTMPRNVYMVLWPKVDGKTSPPPGIDYIKIELSNKLNFTFNKFQILLH